MMIFESDPRRGAAWALALAFGLLACSPAPETPPSAESSPAPAVDDSVPDATPSIEPPTASASPQVCPPARRAGEGSHWAGLVVTFSNGTTETVCVGFDEPTIDGYALLRRSPLNVVAETYSSPMGVGICKLTGATATDGCDYPDQPCFCATDPVRFWTIWRWQDGEWAFSTTGAAETRIADGEVLGYRWGEGEAGGAPSRCDIAQICGSVDPG